MLNEMRDEARGYLRSLAGELTASGLTVAYETPEGEPATVIIRRVTELGADLIAMTTIGQSGMARIIFGSVADKVLKTAPCPILLVRVGEDV